MANSTVKLLRLHSRTRASPSPVRKHNHICACRNVAGDDGGGFYAKLDATVKLLMRPSSCSTNASESLFEMFGF